MAFDPTLCSSLDVLPTLSANTCIPDIGQVVHIAFQKIQTAPSFSETTILASATWTPLITAIDATLVIKSPVVHNFVVPPSEGLFNGGNDNTTARGIPEYRGEGNVTVTGMFRSTNQATIDDLAQLASDSRVAGYTTIWAYFFGASNKITAKSNGAGIKIYNFRVSTTGSEGYLSKNMHNFSFTLAPDWDADLKTFIASFDPTAL